MIFVPSTGLRKSRPAVLSSTTAVDLVPTIVKEGMVVTVESVLVTAGAAGADFTLTWSNGTTSVKLANATPIAAFGRYELLNHHPSITKLGSLTCQASVGGVLQVMCVTIDTGQNNAS